MFARGKGKPKRRPEKWADKHMPSDNVCPFPSLGGGFPLKTGQPPTKSGRPGFRMKIHWGTSWEAQQSLPALYASFRKGMPCVQKLAVISSGGSLLNCYPIKWCSRKPPGKPFLRAPLFWDGLDPQKDGFPFGFPLKPTGGSLKEGTPLQALIPAILFNPPSFRPAVSNLGFCLESP